MSEFKIDFFEFSFLVEACLPPAPIARAMFFQEVSDKHYHQMTDNERNKLFEWLTRNSCFRMEEEDCQVFYDRFNPKNQYKAKTFYNEKEEVIDCFAHKGRFHTSKSTSILEEYIVSTELCERKSPNA